MFEKTLKDNLKKIFDLPRVTFDQPGESQEQDTLFVSVESSKNSIRDKRQIARVQGRLRVFTQNDKIPFGFLSKRIQEADPALTLPFFFFEFEENQPVYQNLVERSVGFVFFFDSQYDPEIGSMNSITIEEQA